MSTQVYIVATPVGNSEDITFRAVEVLKSCDYIACEDTRVTRVLTEKYGIGAKLFDCHKFNEKERSLKILSLVRQGKKIALVSDAGTPGISDPGSVLLRELLVNDIKITSIPGACAVTTFLSMVPRNTEEFAFIGFIPRSFNAQKKILFQYKHTNCVFYESPLRLEGTLQNISEIFGENTRIAVGRELTKIYEEVKIGSVKEIIEYYEKNTLKGEIVAMVFAQDKKEFDEIELKEKIKLLSSEGFSQKDIAKIISRLYDINKNTVYKACLE